MPLTMRDFLCERCGIRFEELVEWPLPPHLPCPKCSRDSERVMGAPMVKRFVVSVQRGKADEKPHPGALDTQPLGDGMSYNDFHSMRKKQRSDRRRARARKMVS